MQQLRRKIKSGFQHQNSKWTGKGFKMKLIQMKGSKETDQESGLQKQLIQKQGLEKILNRKKGSHQQNSNRTVANSNRTLFHNHRETSLQNIPNTTWTNFSYHGETSLQNIPNTTWTNFVCSYKVTEH